ncbi:methionine--tRNA ligase [Plasmodium brasilianum]|uniref:Methionine--tRNA ligase n=1 Tax=Plasmodium brasilianum TaxID=5824 RepID=A0ACB9YA38_PLABR|nr:methionine--tRNA ligase [Plasmodium brasilianum]
MLTKFGSQVNEYIFSQRDTFLVPLAVEVRQTSFSLERGRAKLAAKLGSKLGRSSLNNLKNSNLYFYVINRTQIPNVHTKVKRGKAARPLNKSYQVAGGVADEVADCTEDGVANCSGNHTLKGQQNNSIKSSLLKSGRNNSINEESYNHVENVVQYIAERDGEDEKIFFISTPVYYGNDEPHIGHAYCNVLSDIIKRFMEVGYNKNKRKVIFFSGMDEHGLKIELKSKKMNISSNIHIDNICSYYKRMNEELNVKVNLFQRTSNTFHKSFVQNVWSYLLNNNYIYKDVYKGYYDVNEERYLNEFEYKEEKKIIEKNQKNRKNEKNKESQKYEKNGNNKKHNIIYIEEQNSYFFNILKFKDFLIDFYEKNKEYIFPCYLQKEIMYSLKNDLKNICISRYNTEWGIKIPGEEKGSIYVWFDALLSYVSAILYIVKRYSNNMQRRGIANTFDTIVDPVLPGSSSNKDEKRVREYDFLCSYEDILEMVSMNGAVCGSGDSNNDSNRCSDRGSDRCSDRGSDRCSDRGSDRGSDRCSDRGSDRGSDRCSDIGNMAVSKLFARAWNPHVQIIGRDILKFHGVFYLCLLKSLNLKLPDKIVCHGLIKNENIKMSKSLNNVISPFTLLKRYNTDILRLYFIGSGNIYEDKNFKEKNVLTFELFLRNNVGNLLYRVVSLCLENKYEIIKEIKKEDYYNSSILNECRNMKKKLVKWINSMEYPLFLENLMILIKSVNKYFVHKEPWNCTHNSDKFNAIIYETLECIKFISVFMYAIIPHTCLTILKNLGLQNVREDTISLCMMNEMTKKFIIKKLIKIV